MGFTNLSIISSEVMTITPEIATDMLMDNKSNRAIRRLVVKAYAKDMANGEWRITHQGIAINEKGNVVDGQHRLLAVIESGCSVPMFVTTYKGNVGALLAPIDLQARRSISDITGIGPRFVEALTFIIRNLVNYGISHRIETDVINFTENYPDIMEWYKTNITDTCRRIVTAAPIRAAVLLAYMDGNDFSTQYLAMRGIDIGGMNSSTQYLYKRLELFRGDTSSSKFKHDAFGITFAVAQNPEYDYRVFKKVTIDRAWEAAGKAIKKYFP
jgi:hypothetical protein